MQPSVGDDGDVVVGRDGFEHRHRKRDVVLILGVSLTQNEGIVEKNNFAIDVFDQDEEGFCSAVDFFVPSEVRNDR